MSDNVMIFNESRQNTLIFGYKLYGLLNYASAVSKTRQPDIFPRHRHFPTLQFLTRAVR